MGKRFDSFVEETDPKAVLAIAALGCIFLEIGRSAWQAKKEEWRERGEYLQSEEGLKERVDSRQASVKAKAYAEKKRFDALIEAGFTEEQAFHLMMK